MLQSGTMIAVPQSSVPHPCDFFLSQGWETTIAGYSISVSGLDATIALPRQGVAVIEEGVRWHHRSLKVRSVVRPLPYATSLPNSAVARKSVGLASP